MSATHNKNDNAIVEQLSYLDIGWHSPVLESQVPRKEAPNSPNCKYIIIAQTTTISIQISVFLIGLCFSIIEVVS